jgi:ankyrin repeat domain-containing protein 50
MDTFYGEIMERIFHQASQDATLARRVLIWVAFSRRPVTGREITHVISAEVLSGVIASHQGVQVDSELLTTVCAGILAIDSETGTLRPAHVTLKEYLQRNQEEIFAQSQEYITASCVEYLSLEEFKAGPCKFQFQCQS